MNGARSRLTVGYKPYRMLLGEDFCFQTRWPFVQLGFATATMLGQKIKNKFSQKAVFDGDESHGIIRKKKT